MSYAWGIASVLVIEVNWGLFSPNRGSLPGAELHQKNLPSPCPVIMLV